MKKDIETLLPIILQTINEHNGKIRVFPKGKSMLPLIREGKDSVVLTKADKLNKYDIVLFCSNDGKYALHRICKIKNDNCFLSGDNQSVFEKTDKNKIIAKVVGIYREDNYINLKSKKYKKYVLKIMFIRPFRRIIRKINYKKQINT